MGEEGRDWRVGGLKRERRRATNSVGMQRVRVRVQVCSAARRGAALREQLPDLSLSFPFDTLLDLPASASASPSRCPSPSRLRLRSVSAPLRLPKSEIRARANTQT